MGKIVFKITIVILAVCLIKEIYSRGVGIYKVAVFERNIKDEQYILCKGVRTTGFDWCIIKDETGEEYPDFSKVIRVVGIEDPSNTENYALFCGDNTYVFYITGKRYAYDEEISMSYWEYTVKDWTVLYPVKRDCIFRPSGIFESRRYVTANDLVSRLREEIRDKN